jgi:hypothetical protein
MILLLMYTHHLTVVPQLDGELIREFTSFSEASLNSDSVPQLDGELIREFTSVESSV